MALVIEGVVMAVEPTKGGKWSRVLIGSGRRVNDLVMLPAADAAGMVGQVGKSVKLPVRASVETNAEGRPTKFITFWLDDGKGPAARAAAPAAVPVA